MDHIALEVKDEALDFLVEKALEYKLGARGLRSLCESVFTDAMFSLPSSEEKEFKVDRAYAEKKLSFETAKSLKAVS
jgi:ATP-dependent Clp protease ATP-binding subunit ClpX